MTENPSPLILDDPLAIDDARQAYRRSSELRREAVKTQTEAHTYLNGAERDYRKLKAARYYENMDAPSAGMRDAIVDAESADARFERDMAKSAIRAAEERVAEIDADRQSLNRLVEYSMIIYRSHEGGNQQPAWRSRGMVPA